ncbi:helix-turn-helix domain-containing protein [Nocardia sp. bgisy134]|uniref:helix-turn-helix domain-containing protein n=1 Tax=Nocardia sp. bgisy134 TaxID=3413789 RepID=UPI003D72500C
MSDTHPRRNAGIGTIVQVALDLFIHNGYRATTLEAIERRSGISSCAIAWHFGSKRGLPLAVRTPRPFPTFMPPLPWRAARPTCAHARRSGSATSDRGFPI